MPDQTTLLSIVLLLLTILLLALTGLKKQPGIGAIGALVFSLLSLWLPKYLSVPIYHSPAGSNLSQLLLLRRPGAGAIPAVCEP